MKDCFNLIIASDVHSNYKFLSRLIKSYKSNLENLYLIGDLVDKRPLESTEKVLSLLSNKGIIACFGNHDKVYLKNLEKTIDNNSINNVHKRISLNYLKQLPEFISYSGLVFMHNPKETPGKIQTVDDAKNVFVTLEKKFHDFNICFSGHFHAGFAYKKKKLNKSIEKINSDIIKLKKDSSYLLNPGSLSYQKSYFVFDTINHIVLRKYL